LDMSLLIGLGVSRIENRTLVMPLKSQMELPVGNRESNKL